MTAKHSKLGLEMIAGLTELRDLLKDGIPIESRLTCHRVAKVRHPGMYTPAKVRKVRDMMGASQRVFAKYLGVSVQALRHWEQGVHRPSPLAARFLDEIANQPDYFVKRLERLATFKDS